MKLYNYLSEFAFARDRYSSKFFLVSLPLVILAVISPVVFFILRNNPTAIIYCSVVLLTISIFTIIAVKRFQDRLVTPIRLAKTALENYMKSHEVPSLPKGYTDEVGELLTTIQATLTKLDNFIIEKSDMIDLLSHDLRSPVGRVLSLANLLKIDSDAEREVYADYIMNECTSLLGMLENILLTLKEDNSEFRLERLNLARFMSEVVGFFNFSASEKNISLHTDIDGAIFVSVQSQLFKQAVRNIIGNAIKFSPAGKSIYISAIQTADEVSLSIRDEGLGFDPADMERIFNRFTKAGKKGTHGEKSTGLGLYLSKKIIEKHGGKLIAVSGGVDRGATFTIELHTLITKKPQGKLPKRSDEKKVLALHRR